MPKKLRSRIHIAAFIFVLLFVLSTVLVILNNQTQLISNLKTKLFGNSIIISPEVDNTIKTLIENKDKIIINEWKDNHAVGQIYREQLLKLWQEHPEIFIHTKPIRNNGYKATIVTLKKTILAKLANTKNSKEQPLDIEPRAPHEMPCYSDTDYGFPCVTFIEDELKRDSIPRILLSVRATGDKISDLFWLDDTHVVFLVFSNHGLTSNYRVFDVTDNDTDISPNMSGGDTYSFGFHSSFLNSSYEFTQNSGTFGTQYGLQLNIGNLRNSDNKSVCDIDIYSNAPNSKEFQYPAIETGKHFLTTLKNISAEVGYAGYTYHDPIEILLEPTLKSSLPDLNDYNKGITKLTKAKIYFTIKGVPYEYTISTNSLIKLKVVPNNALLAGKLVFDAF